MVSKISYFVLFEIIIFAKGNPAYRQDSNHEEHQYGLKKLMEEIIKKGNYDVMLNHHEDHPGSHHEDFTHITSNSGKPNSRYYNDKPRHAKTYQGAIKKNVQYNNHPSYTNRQNYNVFQSKKPKAVENKITVQETKQKTQTRFDQENIDDVLAFLNNLDNTVNVKGNNNLELRCSGNRCGESRDANGNSDRNEYYMPNRDYNNIINDNSNRYLRCNGRSCSISLIPQSLNNDRNNGESLRCYGNRCNRKANDRDDTANILRLGKDDDDDGDDIESFRCVGDRCGVNRDNNDDRNGIYTLRCVGDRCGVNRNDDDNDDDTDDTNINYFRCVGDRCGVNREDDDDRDVINSFRCVGDRCGVNSDADDDRVSIDSLRCDGDRCGINRNDDNVRDGIDSLRCVGDRCGFNRDDYDDEDRVSIDSLRCVGDRCGINRNDDDVRVGIDSLRCVGDRCGFNREDDDDKDDINSLRCVGDRCGRNRNDNEYYKNDAYSNNLNPNDRNDDRVATDNLRCVGDRCGKVDDDRNNLRCVGNRCGRSRNDDEDQDSNEAEEIFDTFLSRALDVSLRGNEVSSHEKSNLLKKVKIFLGNLKNKLVKVVNQVTV